VGDEVIVDEDSNAPHEHEHAAPEWVSTGSLPSDVEIQTIVSTGYKRYRHVEEGSVADYIPALAEASPEAFGVAVAGVHGRVFSIGDAEQEFTIQSISKLFVFALVCNTLGPAEARSTGDIVLAAQARLEAVDRQITELALLRCRLRRLVEVCEHGNGDDCVALRLSGDDALSRSG